MPGPGDVRLIIMRSESLSKALVSCYVSNDAPHTSGSRSLSSSPSAESALNSFSRTCLTSPPALETLPSQRLSIFHQSVLRDPSVSIHSKSPHGHNWPLNPRISGRSHSSARHVHGHDVRRAARGSSPTNHKSTSDSLQSTDLSQVRSNRHPRIPPLCSPWYGSTRQHSSHLFPIIARRTMTFSYASAAHSMSAYPPAWPSCRSLLVS